MGVLSFISDLQGLAQRKALAEQELAQREADRQAEGFRQQAQLAGMRELEGIRAKNERDQLAFKLEQEQKAKDIAKVAADKERQLNLMTVAKSRGMLDPVLANVFAHDTAAQIDTQPLLTGMQQSRNQELAALGEQPTMTEQGSSFGQAKIGQNRLSTAQSGEQTGMIEGRKDWIPYASAASGRLMFTSPMSEADIAAEKGAGAVRRFDKAGLADVAEMNAREIAANNLAEAGRGASPFVKEAGTFDTLMKLSDATSKINANNRQQQVEDQIPVSEEAKAKLRAIQTSALQGMAPLLGGNSMLLLQNPRIQQEILKLVLPQLNGTTTAAPVAPYSQGNTPGSPRTPSLNDIR